MILKWTTCARYYLYRLLLLNLNRPTWAKLNKTQLLLFKILPRLIVKNLSFINYSSRAGHFFFSFPPFLFLSFLLLTPINGLFAAKPLSVSKFVYQMSQGFCKRSLRLTDILGILVSIYQCSQKVVGQGEIIKKVQGWISQVRLGEKENLALQVRVIPFLLLITILRVWCHGIWTINNTSWQHRLLFNSFIYLLGKEENIEM